MKTLRAVLDSFTGEGTSASLDAPEGWGQGRTLYGGMTAALCTHAAGRALPDLPPLRSAQFSFIGPASGPLSFETELLRRGRSSAIVGIDCRTPDGLAARAILICAAPRATAIAQDDVPAPDAPPPEACEDLHRSAKTKLSFIGNFSMKLVRGNRALSGGDPTLLTWCKLDEDDGVDPLISFLALADALPPPAMSLLPKWGPVSTMTWHLDFSGPVTTRGWHLLESVAEQTGDGYSLQAMNVWAPGGRRIAAARQVVAIFA